MPWLAVVVGAACGGGGDAAPAAVGRDSAGIAIVESAAPALAAADAPRLAPEPTLVVGDDDGSDPTQQLFGVQASRRLRDGRVVVADGGSAQVRVYGADGALRRAAGGKGGGPGEFEALTWLDVGAGDSVIAYDARLRRFTVLDDTGAYVRDFSPADTGGAPALPRPVALLADGAVLATRSALAGRAPPTSGRTLRDTAAFVRIGRDGAVRELAARVPAAERAVFISPQAVEVLTPPFAHVLAAAGGGERAFAAGGAGYEVAEFDGTGRLVRLLRVPGLARPVTPADVDAHVARSTAELPDPASRERVAARMRDLPIPERMPAIGRLLLDDGGRLWAMDFLAPGDTVATWRVFDAEGRWLAAVPVPRAFTVHAVRDGHAVGVWRDEDGVEQVRVHAVLGGF